MVRAVRIVIQIVVQDIVGARGWPTRASGDQSKRADEPQSASSLLGFLIHQNVGKCHDFRYALEHAIL